MITYVSKENNLGPGDTIRYIWGLKGPIFISSLFLMKTSRYCHSPGVVGGGSGVVQKL